MRRMSLEASQAPAREERYGPGMARLVTLLVTWLTRETGRIFSSLAVAAELDARERATASRQSLLYNRFLGTQSELWVTRSLRFIGSSGLAV